MSVIPPFTSFLKALAEQPPLLISSFAAAAMMLVNGWTDAPVAIAPAVNSGAVGFKKAVMMAAVCNFAGAAAMMAAGIAPGMNRSFTAESWRHLIPARQWYDAVEEATELMNPDVDTDIQGYDIDDTMVSIARENARLAGVDKLIHFQKRGVDQLSHSKKYGFIVTNPPYGERLEEKQNLPALYRVIGERFKSLDSWSLYLITAYEQAENALGLKAAKNRKIYNGMMKTYFYQFPGPKPPKRQ